MNGLRITKSHILKGHGHILNMAKEKVESHVRNDIDAVLAFRIWATEENPMSLLDEDDEFAELFREKFELHCRERQNLVIYRGTSNPDRINLKIGDAIDYSTRYTSWTTNRAVASYFTDSETKVIFKLVCPLVKTVKIISDEDEHILSPMKLVVIDIYKEDNSEIVYECLLSHN